MFVEEEFVRRRVEEVLHKTNLQPHFLIEITPGLDKSCKDASMFFDGVKRFKTANSNNI